MAYISNRRSRWPAVILCRVPDVSESGYYKHLRFENKPDKDADLLAQIYELVQEDEENANDGVRRIYDYLRLNLNYIGSFQIHSSKQNTCIL